MRCPSGDHTGSRSSYGPDVTGFSSLPSALIVQICHVLLRYAWNARRVPSGDHDGCRASIEMSVIAFATPPLAGIVHNVPNRSIAIVRPSGDSAAAIDVPSWSVTWTARPSGRCASSVNANAENTVAPMISLRIAVPQPCLFRTSDARVHTLVLSLSKDERDIYRNIRSNTLT